MRNVEFGVAALDDLRGIVRYVNECNPDAAGRLSEEFENEIEKLRIMPEIGHRRDDVNNPAYRCRRVGAYIIVYRFDDGAFDRHQSRPREPRLQEALRPITGATGCPPR